MYPTITPDTYWDLFAGYTAFWLILGFFVVRLISAQARLSKRCQDLEAQIRAQVQAEDELKKLRSNANR